MASCFLNVESILISSDLIASQLLLEIAHAIPLSPQSVSSHLISTHLISRLVSFFHLILSHLNSSVPCSALLGWSQLFSSLLMSPELFSSLLISPQLILGFLKISQLFSILLSSPQLMSAHLMPSHLFFLFSHLLRSSHTSSADLRCCQLVSPHLSSAQRTLKSPQLFSGPKLAPNKDLGAKASDPLYAASFCTEKLVHTEDCTHRSFYTGTGKLVHRDKEAFTHNKLLHRASFYTQQAFTHTSFCTQKLLHREAFTQRSLYTAKILHTASFYTHREACTQKSFYAQQAFTQRTPYTEKFVHREAFTHNKLYTAFTHSEPPHRGAPTFHREDFTHSKLLQREAFTHRSFYTHKPLRTTMPEIAAPKLGLGARAKIRRFWQRNL